MFEKKAEEYEQTKDKLLKTEIKNIELSSKN